MNTTIMWPKFLLQLEHYLNCSSMKIQLMIFYENSADDISDRIQDKSSISTIQTAQVKGKYDYNRWIFSWF